MEEENKKKVSTPIHEQYRHLLTSIEAIENDDSPVLDSEENASMQCVIWGALYLEALVNFYCHELIFQSSKDDEKSAYLTWKLVKYSNINQKIDFILDSKDIPRTHRKEKIKPIKEVFEIRNRLVHFKEPYFETEIEHGGLILFWKANDEDDFGIEYIKAFSPIEETLQSKKLQNWKKQVLDSGDWLTICVTRQIPLEFYEEYHSKDGLVELEEKYGSGLEIVWNYSFEEFQDHPTEKIKNLENEYGLPIQVTVSVSMSEEELWMAALNYNESKSDGEKRNLDNLPQSILDKYEEWKKEHK